MDQKAIKQDFENKRTKKQIVCHLFQYKFTWQFCDMTKIVNADDFISFMKKATNTDINHMLERDIRSKIKQLRDNIAGSDKIAWKYLLETYDDDFDLKVAYQNYLQMVYGTLVKFISDSLITYIFYNLIHKNRVINSREVDVDEMYLYQIRHFQIDLMRFERDILRQLKNKDSSFNEFYEQFLTVVVDAKLELEKLRNKIWKEKEN